MINAKQVAKIVDSFAPFNTAWADDNCGLNIDCGNETENILVALDVNETTVAQAVKHNCGIIVSHHPLFYGGRKQLSPIDSEFIAIKNNVSVIAAHTCWDFADGGVNDVLADMLKLTGVVCQAEGVRIGTLPEMMSPARLAAYVADILQSKNTVYADGKRPIKRVALVGGGAGFMTNQMYETGADAFITGEMHHHNALFAQQAGFTVVAAGHFETEAISLAALAKKLRERCGANIIIADESPALLPV